MKTDKEIADKAEKQSEDALTRMEEAVVEVAEIYAATMLYAYNKWLGVRHSSKALVQQFLEGSTVL